MVPAVFDRAGGFRRFRVLAMDEKEGHGNARPSLSPKPDDAELSKRLRELDRRLGESRPEPQKPGASSAPVNAGFGMAMRYGADFVGAVVIGAALGWGVDRLFGTTPFGLIALLILGFAAGVLNVMRSAGIVRTTPDGRSDFSSLPGNEKNGNGK